MVAGSAIELVLPHRREGPPHVFIGIEPGLHGGDDDTIGEARIDRPVLRLQMEFEPALVAPALQFDHPVALPHRVAPHQRQTAGFGKQVHQHHGLEIYLEIVGTCDLAKRTMPDIGRGRLKREIVVDLARHAIAPKTVARNAHRHPNRRARRLQQASLLCRLLQCGDCSTGGMTSRE
jgi:hypothetical protein